jgi:hypothetical protein
MQSPDGRRVNTAMKIAEIIAPGFNPPSFQWHQTENQWNAIFEIGDRQIEIIIVRISGTARQSAWRIDFRRSNKIDRRGTIPETTAIIGTITTAIGQFLNKVQPEYLSMSPTDAVRERLYRAVLKRMFPAIAHAYSLDEQRYGTLFGEFVLRRKPEWLYHGW